MSVAVGSSWMSLSPHPHHQPPYHNPHIHQQAQIPPRNDVELSRDTLITVLEYFSTLLPAEFQNTPIRLVVHGGACMLLHPELHRLAQQQAYDASSTPGDATAPRRTTTRDVDIILRSFVLEYRKQGFQDPAERLRRCIRATAKQFRLGADWMNSDADVALPMAVDSNTNKQYDPIYNASIQQNNIHVHTIFTSENRMLTLISVTPFWAVALKLVRYTKWDPGDIILLLRNGTHTVGTLWNAERVEQWLVQLCWPMGYSNYTPSKRQDMRAKIAHAVQGLPPQETATNSNNTGTPARVTGPPNSLIPPGPPSWMMATNGSSPAPPAGTFHQTPPAWGSPPPPSQPSSPSPHTTWNQGVRRSKTEDSTFFHPSVTANGTIEQFDWSISQMLSTRNHSISSMSSGSSRHRKSMEHETGRDSGAQSPSRIRTLWRKKDKKKKKKDRNASRRLKQMFGITGPDDSDPDTEVEGASDSDSETDSGSESESEGGRDDNRNEHSRHHEPPVRSHSLNELLSDPPFPLPQPHLHPSPNWHPSHHSSPALQISRSPPRSHQGSPRYESSYTSDGSDSPPPSAVIPKGPPPPLQLHHDTHAFHMSGRHPPQPQHEGHTQHMYNQHPHPNHNHTSDHPFIPPGAHRQYNSHPHVHQQHLQPQQSFNSLGLSI